MADAFGAVFAARLAELGLSTRAFAKKVGCSKSLPGMVVRGERKPPLDDLVKWVAALAVQGDERDQLLELGLLAHLPADYRRWLEQRWRAALR